MQRWNHQGGESQGRLIDLPAVLLAACLLIGTLALPAHAKEKRIALIVGNESYPTSPLKNPVNDARLIADTLKRLNFDVTLRLNLGVKDFRRELRDYVKKLETVDGASVFFYAGHGVQIAGRNYLLPVDVNLTDEDEVRDESVDIDEIYLSRLDRARTPVRIVILDACRDNPFGKRSRGLRTVRTGLAEMGARGALIAYSSGPGETADDGPPGKNSVYTSNLAQELKRPGIEVERMFKNVAISVRKQTQDRQVPWVNSSLAADFTFNPTAVAPREPGPARPTVLEQREAEIRRPLDEASPAKPGSTPNAPTVPAASVTPTAPSEDSRTVRTNPDAGRKPIGAKETAPNQTAPNQTAPNQTAPNQTAPNPPAAAPATQQPPPTTTTTNPRPPKPVAKSPNAEGRPPAEPRRAAGSERCYALLARAQLGESLSAVDMAYIQKECR